MIGRVFRKLQGISWLPYVLTALGVGLYFVQAWAYAHIQTSFLDEGGYLYVGDLYARGILHPFQDYGIPHWYAPLSYLIPGQIEQWFGASLLTGRYFSVFCGLVMLIPLWFTARRFGGKWAGAAVIWAMALTPVSAQVYSLALSQALVACLLAWSLLCVLGGRRPAWQIVVGSLLAGLIVTIRHNLIPIVPLLVAYVFWQHGKKAGWWSLGGSLLPILVVHAIYWPNILQLWAMWLPAKLTPFLDPYRFPAVPLATETGFSLSSSLLSFALGFRFHYFAMLGFIVCIFLWPRAREWKDATNRRAAWFLGVLFLILALMHAWATVTTSDQGATCTFCFTPYLSFFDITALLLVIISASSWRQRISKLGQVAGVIFALLLSIGLGYACFDRFGSWLLNIKFPAITRGLNPSLWTPFITLWDILSNKYHLDYWASRVPVSIAAALLLGIILLVLFALIYRRLVKKKIVRGYSYGSLFLVTALGLGIFISPLMGGTYREKGLCGTDIPKTYQQIGKTLADVIPAGSQVYWEAKTAVPLLYTPGIRIYSPQIYGLFSFRLGGDSDQLVKYGLWNDDLARRWREEADFIVTEVNWYQTYHPGGDLDPAQFIEYDTIPANPCDAYSYLVIYQKVP